MKPTRTMSKHSTWAIIPAYNERARIGSVIEGTLKHLSNVVVVDDGSKDGTGKKSLEYDIILLTHVTNLGKGSALKTGCEYAFSKGAKSVVLLDSDGQHNPEEIEKLIAPLEHGKDIVFGTRTFDKRMPFMMKLGNKIINKTVKVLFGMDLKDTQSGYRAFTKKAFAAIKWKSSDYSVESEMIANAGKAGLKHQEVEIETIYSDAYKGTTMFDGIKIVGDMIRWRITK